MDEKAAIEEAVRSRLSFLRALKDPEMGLGIFLDQMGYFHAPHLALPKHYIRAQRMRMYYLDKMTTGQSFFLPKEECEVLDAAWESYPDAKMDFRHFIKPNGFVYFEKEITDPQDKDPHTPLQALSWSVDRMENLPFDLDTSQEDPYAVTILGFLNASPIIRAGGVVEGFPRIYPIVAVVWELNSDDGGRLKTWSSADLAVKDRREPYIKVLHSFFNIIRTQLAETLEPKERTKKTRDRLKHATKQFPNLNTGIQVVKFRPTKQSSRKSAKNSGRELTVRYWTAPFFVNQYFPSRDDHEVMLRRPQLRGPEGAPIVGRERIFLPPKPIKSRKKQE